MATPKSTCCAEPSRVSRKCPKCLALTSFADGLFDGLNLSSSLTNSTPSDPMDAIMFHH